MECWMVAGRDNAMAYGCNDKTLRPWKDACVRAAARLRPSAPPPTTTVAPAARRQLDEALLRAGGGGAQ